MLRGVRSPPRAADALAVAAALACRLLNSPACRLCTAAAAHQQPRIGATIVAIVPQTPSTADELGLGPSDVLALRIDEEETRLRLPAGSLCFAPCEAADVAAAWVDTLHGARGVSPSSVLQWSKGTVHHATE